MVPRPKYLITTSALLASPSVLAVMVLSAVGALNIWIACLAGMAILIGVLVLLIRPLRRLRGIENQLSSLTDRAPDADIAVHTSDAGGPVGDIIAAIYRLDRIWGHNRKELHDNLQAAQILFDALPDPLLTLDADARLTAAKRRVASSERCKFLSGCHSRASRRYELAMRFATMTKADPASTQRACSSQLAAPVHDPSTRTQDRPRLRHPAAPRASNPPASAAPTRNRSCTTWSAPRPTCGAAQKDSGSPAPKSCSSAGKQQRPWSRRTEPATPHFSWLRCKPQPCKPWQQQPLSTRSLASSTMWRQRQWGASAMIKATFGSD